MRRIVCKAIYRGRELDPGRDDLSSGSALGVVGQTQARRRRDFEPNRCSINWRRSQELRKQAKQRFVLGFVNTRTIGFCQTARVRPGPRRAVDRDRRDATSFPDQAAILALLRLAVVTRSSADYQIVEGKIVKSRKKVSTRGLNRNHNPQFKQVFKSAALTSLRHEESRLTTSALVEDGTRPELARVSVARKLAAIALTVWQREEEYDSKKYFAKA